MSGGRPLVAEVNDWRRFLAEEGEAGEVALRRRHARTGRPLGNVRFLRRLARVLDRRLVPGKPGRPPKKGR